MLFLDVGVCQYAPVKGLSLQIDTGANALLC